MGIWSWQCKITFIDPARGNLFFFHCVVSYDTHYTKGQNTHTLPIHALIKRCQNEGAAHGKTSRAAGGSVRKMCFVYWYFTQIIIVQNDVGYVQNLIIRLLSHSSGWGGKVEEMKPMYKMIFWHHNFGSQSWSKNHLYIKKKKKCTFQICSKMFHCLLHLSLK